jgi:hypothetical protein
VDHLKRRGLEVGEEGSVLKVEMRDEIRRLTTVK